MSDDGEHALGGLTALTTVNLNGCSKVSDNGIRALAGLTDLNLEYCYKVLGNRLHALVMGTIGYGPIT